MRMPGHRLPFYEAADGARHHTPTRRARPGRKRRSSSACCSPPWRCGRRSRWAGSTSARRSPRPSSRPRRPTRWCDRDHRHDRARRLADRPPQRPLHADHRHQPAGADAADLAASMRDSGGASRDDDRGRGGADGLGDARRASPSSSGSSCWPARRFRTSRARDPFRFADRSWLGVTSSARCVGGGGRRQSVRVGEKDRGSLIGDRTRCRTRRVGGVRPVERALVWLIGIGGAALDRSVARPGELCGRAPTRAAQTTNLPSSCITVPSTSSLPPRRRSQTRSVWTADSLMPPDSG